MKITTGKMLYVNTENLALVDGFEANAPYCQLTGERQVVIDVECFDVGMKEGLFNVSPELRQAAAEIAEAIKKEQPNDICVYC